MEEKRLIDACSLKKEIVDWKINLQPRNSDYGTGYFSALSVVEGMLAYAPTVDAVEVVRCRYCKFWKRDSFMCDLHSSVSDEFSGGSYVCMGASDYCSYGERRKNE